MATARFVATTVLTLVVAIVIVPLAVTTEIDPAVTVRPEIVPLAVNSVIVQPAVMIQDLTHVAATETVLLVAMAQALVAHRARVVMTAVTVTIAMRVVGLLLVSALMIIPVATAQQLSKSFRGTRIIAAFVGSITAISGVITSFYLDLAPGALIVMLVILGFIVSIVISSLRRRRKLSESVR
jgi:zinc transport system permease protein